MNKDIIAKVSNMKVKGKHPTGRSISRQKQRL
jgi:hypothetical protein